MESERQISPDKSRGERGVVEVERGRDKWHHYMRDP
jgi:hypothetical protein